jgi:hypothetical protein
MKRSISLVVSRQGISTVVQDVAHYVLS